MEIKDLFLFVMSRLVRGIGMTLALVNAVYSIWCFFLSQKLNYIFSELVLGDWCFIGCGLYEFALKYIYDELGYYR